MGFHLAHGIKHHADKDEDTGSSKELGDRVRDVHKTVEDNRLSRDDGEKNGARQANTAHGIMKVSTSRLTRTDPWKITAMFFQIIGDLQLVELRRHPEIRKEQDHRSIEQ